MSVSTRASISPLVRGWILRCEKISMGSAMISNTVMRGFRDA